MIAEDRDAMHRRHGATNSLTRLRGWLLVAATFSVELTVSTWATIKAILAPSSRLKPAILEMPLDVRSAEGATLFASMVTLTPGTTSIHISEDIRTLYVHVLDAPDHKQVIDRMKASLEARAREVYP